MQTRERMKEKKVHLIPWWKMTVNGVTPGSESIPKRGLNLNRIVSDSDYEGSSQNKAWKIGQKSSWTSHEIKESRERIWSSFGCGFNHRVKDFKIPATIKFRRCHCQGLNENACHESQDKVLKDISDSRLKSEDIAISRSLQIAMGWHGCYRNSWWILQCYHIEDFRR